jgi:hypothetical protein
VTQYLAFGEVLVFAPLSAVATMGMETVNAGSESSLFNRVCAAERNRKAT